jgi:hypothetical protein
MDRINENQICSLSLVVSITANSPFNFGTEGQLALIFGLFALRSCQFGHLSIKSRA